MNRDISSVPVVVELDSVPDVLVALESVAEFAGRGAVGESDRSRGGQPILVPGRRSRGIRRRCRVGQGGGPVWSTEGSV
ncbi:MAG: hypothetical protein Ct9H300mP1_15340 [Planctomycetaceae bacterium]|nr:MAG: hypothetical protein Ct9H300mP1_15340 [Planctomycetaceae bacterium]